MIDLSLLQFIFEGALLSFRGPRIARWNVISDFEEAKCRAWAQTDEFPIWWDLRERLNADAHLWRVTTEGLRAAIDQLVRAYTPLPWVELEDDIASDLTDCVADQLRFDQRRAPLFPMLLEAYTAGGWPCGWDGEYPDGKLCVFWLSEPPSIPEPTSIHDRRVALQKRRLRERIASIPDPTLWRR